MHDYLQAVSLSAQGYGRLLVVPVPQPAAGADAVTTVPGGRAWLPYSYNATFQASAVVSNRQISLVADGGDAPRAAWQSPQRTAVTAGQIALLNWQEAAGYSFNTAAGVFQVAHLPVFPLMAGWRIRTSTISMDAGDQWSAITLTVFEVDVELLARREADSLSDVIGTPELPYQSHPYLGLFT